MPNISRTRSSGPPSRSDPRPSRSRRRHRVVIGLIAIVVLVAAVAILVRDVLATREALVAARHELSSARAAVADGDVPAASAHLGAARHSIAGVRDRVDGPLWQLAARVPGPGRSLRTVRGVVEVAGAATDAADDAVERVGELLGRDGGLDIDVRDGAVSLDPLQRAATAWAGLDLVPLARARDELAAIVPSAVPGVVRAARRDTLDLADQLLGSLRDADALLAALPGFLGGDEPRKYLLALQNNAELRGTGGLIGSYAVLTVDDGAFTLSELSGYGALADSDDPEFAGHRPVPVGDDFARRYQHINAAGFVANVNVDPDLPTTAQVLLDLYAARTGQHLDGIVAIDPVGLGTILGAIGPVALPPEADPTGLLPNPVPASEIARVTMIDAYDVLGGHREAREVYLEQLATAAFHRLFAGDWDPAAVGRQVAAAASRRHLQIYSTHEEEQAAFAELGIDGALPASDAADTPADLLAVSANNAGGNKMDVHVGHTVSGEIVLGPPRDGRVTREADLRIGLDNPLPTRGRDPYIIGNCTITGTTEGCFNGPPGLNRTWFTVWAPDSTELIAARDAAGSPLATALGRIHGHLAVDHHLETPSRSRDHFEVRLRGPVDLHRDGSDLVYSLALWRQTKAIPDRLDLTIVAPQGWSVVDAIVVGGGDGSGMGVNGEPGPPLRIESDAARIRLRGDRNADVHVEVRLRRPLQGRVADWLRAPLW